MKERGPKGDHGQGGDIGPTGAPGPEGQTGVQGITGERGKPGDVGAEGKRGLRGPAFAGPIAWVILVVVITGVLVAQGYQIRANRARIEENERANLALCALQHDLERRVATSKAFLEKNPDGFNGISAADIRMSIQNSERTLKTLAVLDCPIE